MAPAPFSFVAVAAVPQQMDTKLEDDQRMDFDLQMAIFGAP
jgi:hypothetical protein